ncbi:MAG: DUF3179 domain-containing protein [Acidobacteriaceae bacterium]|nr:DUF3179 domain-containing protein [Acidobacteriaceae bacterium]MBV9502847.1 DUF3179 domain-containing protein [Acidobacteriaceae bacterium]
MARPDPNSRWLFISLVVLSLLAVACFAYPLYVIWPFRHQDASELGIALWVKRIGPWLSMLCAALCVAVLVLLWGRLRWFGRTAGVALVLLAAAACYGARVNVYELMFHPAGTPQFVTADHAKVDADDMVVAVRIDNVSRAYPVREMAYHHIINDTVAGEPIAATY